MIGEERLGSGRMFDGIAERYDLLNRINSLGLDRGWRRSTARALQLEPGQRLLDVATGTADFLLEADRQVRGLDMTGLDPSTGMLQVAGEKLKARGVEAELVVGEATALPFSDGAFDRASMCFGIRNVVDRSKALLELLRVLRPGGQLALLELVEPEGPWAFLPRFHTRQIVPKVGALLASPDAYAYLARSIQAFPSAEMFAGQMEAAGFSEVRITRLGLGACALFQAVGRQP